MKELLRKLIRAETTAEKGELAAADIISGELGRWGIDCQIDSWDGNRANIIGWLKSARRRGALLFACHLDVVRPGEADWKYPAFAGVESDSKIYGRGSADMKGGITTIVTAIGQIVESGAELGGDIILLGMRVKRPIAVVRKDLFATTVSDCRSLPAWLFLSRQILRLLRHTVGCCG